MYTRARKTSRIIPAAEPAKKDAKSPAKDGATAGPRKPESPGTSSSGRGARTTASRKKPLEESPPSPTTGRTKGPASKKAKSEDTDEKGGFFLSGISFYLLPLELSQIRRKLLSERVQQFGGLVLPDVAHEASSSSRKEPKFETADYIVLDEHLDLHTASRALVRLLAKCMNPKAKVAEQAENEEKAKNLVVEALEKGVTKIVKADWLGQCFHAKKLLDLEKDADGHNENLLNQFIQNYLHGTQPDDADEGLGSETGLSPVIKRHHKRLRDGSLNRDISYHSDDDHKSRSSSVDSSLSDFDRSFDTKSPDVSLHESGNDDDDITPTNNQPSPTHRQPIPSSSAAKLKLGSGDEGRESNRKADNLQKSNFFLSAASGKVASAANQRIVDQLEELMKTYRNIGDQFRGYAYARAISAIRKYPYPIKSAQQMKDIKNVGPRIASHIMEILETGHLERNDEIVHNDDVNASINRFVNIHGVGTKTAQKWAQMGLRTLDDVRDKISLNAEQKLGLKYYDEFQVKMPRTEVEEIVKIVKDTTLEIKPGFIFEVCGSYRRGRDMCGDVDILMTHPDGQSHETIMEPLVSRLHRIGFVTDDLTLATDGRHKKYFGVCILQHEGAKHRRLDIIIPPYSDWATCVLGWSGSMYFVRSIRDYAHKKNMSLTDYSLQKNVVRNQDGEKIDEGETVDTPTELSIFKALGLPYLSPEERDH